MPELPDVACLQQYADSMALHHRIDDVQAEAGPLLENLSPGVLKDHLRGRTFTRTRRHGKYLFFHLDNEEWLCIRFGITGYLDYYRHADEIPPHTRLLLEFDNDHHLAYSSRRLMGAITLTDDPGRFADEHDLGPDALSLSKDTFKALAQDHTGTIKSWLMDQSIIAGIGNMYADEILFHARIHPGYRVDRLTESQLAGLHRKTGDVLNRAIEARADPDRMPADWLLPLRSRNTFCPHCESGLKKTTVSGRTTFYCPTCQPSPASADWGLRKQH